MQHWEDHLKDMGMIDEEERRRLAYERILREQLERKRGYRGNYWPRQYYR